MAFVKDISVILILACTLNVECAPETTFTVKGKCRSSETHWGDDIGWRKLEACWVAICRSVGPRDTVTLATPCSAGPDISYPLDEQRNMALHHCYPSGRGDLPAGQCCGGYKICAHIGPNRLHFDLINFYRFLDSLA